MKSKIIFKDNNHLKELITNEIFIHGNECYLNHLDVSNVTNMSHMFDSSKFNGDISNWKPYKLQGKVNMFNRCIAPKPYWYMAENTQRAIELYELKEKLDNNLENKNITKIKIKI